MALKLDRDNLGGGVPNKLKEASDKIETTSSNTSSSSRSNSSNSTSNKGGDKLVKVNIPLFENVANKIKDAVDNMSLAAKNLTAALNKVQSESKSPKITEAKIKTTEITNETSFFSNIWDNAVKKYKEMEEEVKQNIANLQNNISSPVALSTESPSSSSLRTIADVKKLESEDFYNTCELNGVSTEQMKKDYEYIVEKKGQEEADLVLKAFIKNRPSNFSDYSFNPTDKKLSPADASNYYFDPNEIGKYQVNSETLKISEVDFEFVQVLPIDCTILEQITYDYVKANTINTMRTMPSELLAKAQNTPGSKVVLTSSNEAMNRFDQMGNKNTNWGGLYNYENDVVIIDAHGTFINNKYYTRDAVIHEFAHRFDDIYVDKKNNTKWQSDNTSWEKYHKEDLEKIPSLVQHGYEAFNSDGSINENFNQNEFFAETIVAYAINPLGLKDQAPREYAAVKKMLGDNTEGFYNENINSVLNGTLKNYSGSLVPEMQTISDENQPPLLEDDLVDETEVSEENTTNSSNNGNQSDGADKADNGISGEPRQGTNAIDNRQAYIDPEKQIDINKLKDYNNRLGTMQPTGNEVHTTNPYQYNRNEIYVEPFQYSYVPPINASRSIENWSSDYETREIAIYANNYYTMLEAGDLDMPDEDDIMINMFDKWNKLYEENKEKLIDLQYKDCPKYQNVKEFFINMMIIYFKSPDDLRKLSPEVYDSYTEIFGADSGGTW